MTDERKQRAPRLGILLQMFAGRLVNRAIRGDSTTAGAANETRSILADALASLNISPRLPSPTSRNEVLEFFQDGFPTLTMDIGRRLAAVHGSSVSNVFHFSTAAAGYLQTYRESSGVEAQVEVLRTSILKQAEDVGIQPSFAQRFLEDPEREWDALFEVVLASDSGEGWSSVVDVKPGIGGLSFDVKKAAQLVSHWLRKR